MSDTNINDGSCCEHGTPLAVDCRRCDAEESRAFQSRRPAVPSSIDLNDVLKLQAEMSEWKRRAEESVPLADVRPLVEALQFYSRHMLLGYEITDSGQAANDALSAFLTKHPTAKP